MLQGEHSAILSTFIKLPFVIKIFVLSTFEWPFYTGFTVITIVNENFPDWQPNTPMSKWLSGIVLNLRSRVACSSPNGNYDNGVDWSY